MIKRKAENKIKAITDLTSDDFTSTSPEKLSIKYDLDGNGIIDEISATHWSRWNILADCKVILNNKELKTKIGSTNRIGILKSKTNNFHNLVVIKF